MYVTYSGDLQAQALVGQDMIPVRGMHDINCTDLEVSADDLISGHWFTDYNLDLVDCFEFTWSATLHGKAKVLKFWKIYESGS